MSVENILDSAPREGARTGPDGIEFGRWFGNSKVVDESGRPLLVYHGTTAKPFERFDNEDIYVSEEGDCLSCQMNFFTDDPVVAQSFTRMRAGKRRVISAYLSFQNPFEIDAKGKMASQLPASATVSPALNQGCDGVIIRNLRDGNFPCGGPPSTIFIALNPATVEIVSQSHFLKPVEMDRRAELAMCKHYNRRLAERLTELLAREPRPRAQLVMSELAKASKAYRLVGNPDRLKELSPQEFSAELLTKNPLAAIWMSKRVRKMRFAPRDYEDMHALVDDLFPTWSAKIADLKPARSRSVVPPWLMPSWRMFGIA